MNKKWKGFVFLDVNNDLLNDAHDLGHGITLRKATLDEIKDQHVEFSFRSWSERRGTSNFINQRMPQDENGISLQGSPLHNPNEWRHAVIECSDKSVFFWNVNLAFSLSEADLRMGLVSLEGGGYSTTYIDFPMLNVRNALGAMFVDHELPSIGSLTEIQENISYVLSSVNKDFPSEIREILGLFSSLDNLPDSSFLKVLGYFSVIEGLLSHCPAASDRVDSIQRQLIRNINLLNNRLKRIGRDITFDDFGATSPEKVLKKLYAFRSAIAHGGNLEQSMKDVYKMRVGKEQGQESHLWIHDWLRNMTKKLLLAAIIEPELVTDLK